MKTKIKWKPIKGEKYDFVTVVMQWKAPIPLLGLIFCRLQPTGGFYLNFSAR